MDHHCPAEVSGTSVTVEDTANGAALVFVTTGDVAELRRRVANVATKHNEHHAGMGPLPTGTETASGGHEHHGGHAGHGAPAAGHDAHAGHGAGGAHAGHMGGMIGVHSKASPEDIEGGVKLVFVAFPDGVAQLQSELRTHAQHMASGTCQMGDAKMDHSTMGHGDMDHSKMGH